MAQLKLLYVCTKSLNFSCPCSNYAEFIYQGLSLTLSLIAYFVIKIVRIKMIIFLAIIARTDRKMRLTYMCNYRQTDFHDEKFFTF